MNALPFSPLTLRELNRRHEEHYTRAAGRCQAVFNIEGSISGFKPYDVECIDSNFRAANEWHAAAMIRATAMRAVSA